MGRGSCSHTVLAWLTVLAALGCVAAITRPVVVFHNVSTPLPSLLPDNVVQITALLPSEPEALDCYAKTLAIAADLKLDDFHFVGSGARFTGTIPGRDVQLLFNLVAGSSQRDAAFDVLDAMCYKDSVSACNRSSLLLGPMTTAAASGAVQTAQMFDVFQLSTVSTHDAFAGPQAETYMSVAPSLKVEALVLAAMCQKFGWQNVALLVSQSLADMSFVFTSNAGTIKPEITFVADDLAAQIQAIAEGTTRIIVALLDDSVDVTEFLQALNQANILGNGDSALDGEGWAVVTSLSLTQRVLALDPDGRDQAAGLVGLGPLIQTTNLGNEFNRVWKINQGLYNCQLESPTQEYALAGDTMVLAVELVDVAVQLARQQHVTAAPRDIITQIPPMVNITRALFLNGITGNVPFTPDGRFTPLTILNVLRDGTTNVVGSLTSSVNASTGKGGPTLSVDTEAVIWPNGHAKPPLSSTVVNIKWKPRPGLLTNLFVYSICVIAVAVAFIIAVIWYRKTKIMNWSSPWFCVFILFGPIIGSVPDLIGTLIPSTGTLAANIGCIHLAMFKMLAFVVTFSGVFARTYRIHKIFGGPNPFKNKKFPPSKLWRIVGIAVLLFNCIYVPWALLTDPAAHIVHAPVSPAPGSELVKTETYSSCRPNNTEQYLFHWGMIVVKLVLLMWGAVLAYRTRGVPEGYNESRYLAICIYNAILVAALATPIIHISSNRPDDVLTLDILTDSVPLVFTMFILFVPKFVAARQELTGASSSTEQSTDSGYESIDGTVERCTSCGVKKGAKNARSAVASSRGRGRPVGRQTEMAVRTTTRVENPL